MRGAPLVGFSATIRKIRARTSLPTRFRPPTRLTLEIHDQYKRNPARCQFTTLRGVTKTSGFLHPDQNDLNATQNSLCRAVNRRRGCCACRASNCRRRARFSRTRSSRERKVPTNQPRKCRSDTIMARIVSGKSESSFSQVIHSAGVRRFGEAQVPLGDECGFQGKAIRQFLFISKSQCSKNRDGVLRALVCGAEVLSKPFEKIAKFELTRPDP